jgi:hypothetical protein
LRAFLVKHEVSPRSKWGRQLKVGSYRGMHHGTFPLVRWRHFRRRQPRAAPRASAGSRLSIASTPNEATDRARNGTPSRLDFFVLSGKVLAPHELLDEGLN